MFERILVEETMYEISILSRLHGLMYVKSDWIQEIWGQLQICHTNEELCHVSDFCFLFSEICKLEEAFSDVKLHIIYIP